MIKGGWAKMFFDNLLNNLRKKKFKLSLVWPIITSIQGTNPVSMNPCIMIFVGLEPLKVDVVIVKGCERLRNLGG